MDAAQHYLDDLRQQLESLKTLADGAIAQLSDEQLFQSIDAEANSVAVIMRHISGNLRSRFTEFLTSDGEKPDRNRDGEFEMPDGTTRETVMAGWESGFRTLLNALAALTPADLLTQVTIRREPHTVLRALQRAVGHIALHVGQIVFLAKHLRGASWRTLSIPRGQSEQFDGRRRF